MRPPSLYICHTSVTIQAANYDECSINIMYTKELFVFCWIKLNKVQVDTAGIFFSFFGS